MMESGYYPAGAEFDPRAPWNEKEPRMIPCPVCNGKGYTYYNEDGDEISEDEYNALPSDCRGKDPCDECNGEGEIEYEYKHRFK